MKVVPGEEAMGRIEAMASIVERNHEVVLSIPDILSRLVKLLYHYKLPHSPQVCMHGTLYNGSPQSLCYSVAFMNLL